MRILSVYLQNFASYEELQFDFQDQGLCLIQGPTGAGKSTLCDAIPWVLFGTTAKGGQVNEVLSWPGDKITKGILELYKMRIVRTRGPKAKDNDLYWMEFGGYEFKSNHVEHRGKDIPDTQRLINQKLGMDADTYLTGAYYHEFSQTAQFFQTNAKNRRQLCEQIVDLEFAKSLDTKVGAKYKATEKELKGVKFESLKNMQTHLEQSIKQNQVLGEKWWIVHNDKIEACKILHINFDANKAKKVDSLLAIMSTLEARLTSLQDEKPLRLEIENLSTETCDACGSLLHSNKKEKLVAKLQKIRTHNIESKVTNTAFQSLQEQLKEENDKENTYLAQLEGLNKDANPYEAIITNLETQAATNAKALQLAQEAETQYRSELADLELLSDIVDDLRSTLVKNTIVGLEEQTNKFLADYFDAEIRVEFTAQDADKLDIQITKDGNQAAFTQLSKGQRQLLKLCFGVSVMKQVANHNGISLNAVFFDEALTGLDGQLTLKAYRLLESLQSEHESIFMVDHSPDLKAMVPTQFVVSLDNGRSTIEKSE